MPKKSIKPRRAKFEFEEDGYVMQRREAIKKNRLPHEKAELEQQLAEYAVVMRRLFKLGFVRSFYVSYDTRTHERNAQNFRTGERMEIFEAKQAAARKANRKARHAA